jgi:glycosyltransferase involved in cell wall biosynthesis
MKSRMLVAVLTKNEELNIGACLDSAMVLGCDVCVVDSGSTDATVAIAEAKGARVEYHEFVSIARQRNWVLEKLGGDYDWILFVDADERISPALARELAELEPPGVSGFHGYYVPRHFHFLGKRLRYGGLANNRVLRLLDPARSKVVEQTRTLEYAAVEGRVGDLSGPLLHENLKPFSDWIAKHNWYSTREAEDEVAGIGYKSEGVTENRLRSLLNALVLRRLPPILRPFLLFGYSYFLRLGFLDGKVGFVYHFLHDFWYPLITAVKVEELRRRLDGGKNA